MKKLNFLMALGLMVLLMMNVWQCSKKPEVIVKQTTDTVRTETMRYDTIFIEREPVVMTVEKPVLVYRDVPVMAGEDSTSVYQDTTRTENYDLFYRASVTGRLNRIDLGLIDRRPELIKTITEKVTVTNTKEVIRPQNGFFIGGGLVLPQNVHNPLGLEVNATLLRRKWMYSYGYDLLQRQHRVGLGFKLF